MQSFLLDEQKFKSSAIYLNVQQPQQPAEKVTFPRLLKKGPACAEASAGRQMQVELCETPFCRGP
jgi:hypothetical protein